MFLQNFHKIKKITITKLPLGRIKTFKIKILVSGKAIQTFYFTELLSILTNE